VNPLEDEHLPFGLEPVRPLVRGADGRMDNSPRCGPIELRNGRYQVSWIGACAQVTMTSGIGVRMAALIKTSGSGPNGPPSCLSFNSPPNSGKQLKEDAGFPRVRLSNQCDTKKVEKPRELQPICAPTRF
jgi:hypothetical protein